MSNRSIQGPLSAKPVSLLAWATARIMCWVGANFKVKKWNGGFERFLMVGGHGVILMEGYKRIGFFLCWERRRICSFADCGSAGSWLPIRTDEASARHHG